MFFLKFIFKLVYFGRYALCDAIYTRFYASSSLEQKTKKTNFGKTALKIWSQICGKKHLCVHKTTLQKKFKN